ncbi:MAG: LCP family protein [Deltaproteobacteria bacterium]|nr:LCP family protein [Deltaproteobacteria bacterium]
MEPDFKTRRKVACTTSLMALIILVVYTRCSNGTFEPLANDISSISILDAGSVPGQHSELIEAQAILEEDETEDPQDVEYLLLLGVDRSGGQIGRTDSILVVALNHATGGIGVISLPRDLLVDIPGLDPGRINTVYRLGDRMLGEGHGLNLLKEVIEKELGITVNHTTIADFAGFERIVDALGGIPVDVKCPIEDCFISPGTAGCKKLSLRAKRQRFDGETALLFARSRHGRTDLDRSRRQQSVLLGLWERLVSFDTLVRLPELWHELSSHVKTDVDLAGVIRLVSFAAKANASDLHGLVLKPPIVDGQKTRDGKQVLVLSRKRFDAALADLFEAPLPGARKRPVCPKSDVALHWRERLAKNQSAPDAGTF